MSADNGIYILESEGPEYRVIHAQAIDNLYWWWDDERLYDSAYVEEQEKNGILNPFKGQGGTRGELNPRELIEYFGESKVFNNKGEAFEKAMDIYTEIMDSDYPIVEYGIQFIKYDNKFPNFN